jgi:hypothetical protein
LEKEKKKRIPKIVLLFLFFFNRSQIFELSLFFLMLGHFFENKNESGKQKTKSNEKNFFVQKESKTLFLHI